MAGYFRKLADHIYLGSYKAGEKLENGLFVEITANGVKKIAAAGDAEFRVVEKTSLWGKPAVVLNCTYEGKDEIYVTESEIENYGDKGDFNDADYAVEKDHFVKMRRPAINDELIVSVDDTTYASLTEGATVKPAAGGSIA
jgi:hypothetical protein